MTDFDGPSGDGGGDEGVSDAPDETAEYEDADTEASEEVEPGEGDENAETAPDDEPDPEPEADPDDAVHKVAIDGKEMDLKLRDLKRIASHKLTAEARFREAAAIRKESEAKVAEATERLETIKAQAKDLVEFFRTDPENALIQLGVDPYKWAAQIGKKIEAFEKMTPEQRKLYQERQRLTAEQREWREKQEAERQEAEKREKKTRSEAEQRQQAEFRARFVDSVHDQLDGLGFAEDDADRREVIARAASIASKNLADKVKMPLDMVVRKAVEDVHGFRSQVGERYLKSLPPEKLLEMVGPERVREIRGREARESARKPATKGAPRRPPTKKKKEPNVYQSYEEIFRD